MLQREHEARVLRAVVLEEPAGAAGSVGARGGGGVAGAAEIIGVTFCVASTLNTAFAENKPARERRHGNVYTSGVRCKWTRS